MKRIFRILAVVSALVLLVGFVWARSRPVSPDVLISGPKSGTVVPQEAQPSPSPTQTFPVLLPGSKSPVIEPVQNAPAPSPSSEPPLLLPGSKSGDMR